MAYFLFNRTDFVLSSRQVVATVEQISAYNTRCGKRGRRSCTKFKVTLKYQVGGRDYRIDVPAGRTSGHNQPVEFSKYRAGDQERMVYDLRRPQRAYRDTTWALWDVPILILLVQIAFFIASMNDTDRRRAEIDERLAQLRGNRGYLERQAERRS